MMHKVFITYHHDYDQDYKKCLLRINEQSGIFIDKSVDTGDISPNLPAETIRTTIRDQYLKDSTVTILLVGTETRHRKHVDWELYSSMIDGPINKKSGILVINLPSTNCHNFTAAHGNDEKSRIHPEFDSWTTIDSREEYERLYPCVPERVIDNLLEPKAYISVVPWVKAINPTNLRFLINATFKDRTRCKYYLGRPMKQSNSRELADRLFQ